MSGGALLLLAVLYGLATGGFPAGRGEPGPAFFPLLLSAALGAVAIVILAKGLGFKGPGGRRRRARGATTGVSAPTHHGVATPIRVVLLTVSYVAIFDAAGYAASTWLYTLLVTITLRQRRPLVLLAAPIFATVFIYLLFEIGLGASLPTGHWGGSSG